MALTPTITYVSKSGSTLRVGFNVALSGNYATGGETINLATAAQDAAYQGMLPAIESLGAPIDFDLWDSGGGIKTIIAPVIGTSPAAAGKMKLASALNTEIGNGVAYSGLGIVSVSGEAVFNNL